jgi:hypothetical protein
LTDLADEKVSFFDAAILIFSPFAGLRPSRSGVALTFRAACRGVDNVLEDVVDDGLGLHFAYAMRISDLCDEFGCVHSGFLENRKGGLYRIASKSCHYAWRWRFGPAVQNSQTLTTES